MCFLTHLFIFFLIIIYKLIISIFVMCHNFSIFTTDHISFILRRKQMFGHIGKFYNSTALANNICRLVIDSIRHSSSSGYNNTALQYLYNIYESQFFKPFMK
jgi:hypothetical protein